MSNVEHGPTGIPVADEAREAFEAARREGRALTETERAIAGAEALTPQEALASIEAARRVQRPARASRWSSTSARSTPPPTACCAWSPSSTARSSATCTR